MLLVDDHVWINYHWGSLTNWFTRYFGKKQAKKDLCLNYSSRPFGEPENRNAHKPVCLLQRQTSGQLRIPYSTEVFDPWRGWETGQRNHEFHFIEKETRPRERREVGSSEIIPPKESLGSRPFQVPGQRFGKEAFRLTAGQSFQGPGWGCPTLASPPGPYYLCRT